MNRYIIRSLDRQGRVALAQAVLCRDDLDALAQGERHCGRNDVEIWQEIRLVARVKRGNAPLNAQDARCL